MSDLPVGHVSSYGVLGKSRSCFANHRKRKVPAIQVLDVARALVDLRAAVSLLAIDSQRKDAVMKEMEDLGVSIDAVLEKAKNLVQSNG
jgi:hypothetical protein